MSAGDIVMLTAAVRDLHKCYPGRFITDVRTPFPHLWENNPYITPLDDKAPDVRTIHCECQLINASNERPYHYIHAFMDHLNAKLELNIRPMAFKGDIHLSQLEKSWMSQIHEITDEDSRFWIVVAGGKRDYTIKWWEHARFQTVVDHFRGRINFVQAGEKDHVHPPLKGVTDLRGKTNLRQLVRLVYHAEGVLCPVTLMMHLAAAVETRPGFPPNRPCVVVAGGREPPHWEAYPHHQFLHTVGALQCCARGGCWKSRSVPLGDGDDKDRPDQVCVNLVGTLPKCMDMIRPSHVIEAIERYYEGGALKEPQPAQIAVPSLAPHLAGT